MDITSPYEFTTNGIVFLIYNTGSSMYIKNMDTGVAKPIVCSSKSDGISLDQRVYITELRIGKNPGESASIIRLLSVGKYLVVETTQGFELCDYDLNTIINLPKTNNGWTLYYNKTIDRYIMTHTDPHAMYIYDTNLKLIHKRIGEVKWYADKYAMINTRYFDCLNLTESFHRVVKRYTHEEIVETVDQHGFPRMQLRKNVFSETECAICTRELAERYVTVPCGHINTCKECLTNMKKCPICRQDITNVIKIHT